MPCYHPLQGYRARGGKHIVFNLKDGWIDQKVTVPCGQCIGCRLERSRQWAMRCMHEASLYEDNCFITLTYNNEHLPEDGSLHKEHFQKFMKRLRKRTGKKIRFFHCGEYGKVLGVDGSTPLPHPIVGGREALGRPHYHAILFGEDFTDEIGKRKVYSVRDGIPLYTSEFLEDVWGKGFVTIGEVTNQSAAYVARYVMKKVGGEMAEDYYKKLEGGVWYNVKPEYTTMSRRPGIGQEWIDKYLEDVFPRDELVIEGKKRIVPKYYWARYKETKPAEAELVRKRRVKAAKARAEDNNLERLRVKEKCLTARISKLKRGLTE